MALTNNPNVLKWLDEMIALTTPDKVVWIGGSEEQLKALKEEALVAREEASEAIHASHSAPQENHISAMKMKAESAR